MNANTPRMSRAEAKARTRQLLLDSGRDVFARKGFAAATVEEIAQQAGFTRGAFYANFRDKHDLFWAVVATEDESTFGAMELSLEAAHGDEMRRIERWFEQLLGDRPLQRAYDEVMAQAGPEDRARFAEIVAANRAHIVRMVQAYVTEYEVTLPVGIEQMAALFLAVGNGLAQQRLLDEDAVPLSLFADAFEFLWVGALSRSGSSPRPPAASDRMRS